jgi:acyl-coenzyme A synthetase/AMP-(fatty) acid ligase
VKSEPLLAVAPPQAVLAFRDGRPISRPQFIADATALAARLPTAGTMLNLSIDRYRFAVGLGAALLRGQTSLLPPNHTPHTVSRLRASFVSVYALVESDDGGHGLPVVVHDAGHVPLPAKIVAPSIDADMVAAQVLTSGSTGEPVPHAKPWHLLVASARTEAARLAQAMGRAALDGVSLVATVPPQHMYGFESSVLLALHGGAAFDAGRPFYPADIAAALERVPAPRMLVTTPFHLKTLLDAGVALPSIDLVVCATAPLSPQLAARAESALAAPLVEIYGCTEAGQVATRRPTSGPEWRTFDGLVLGGDGDAAIVSGGHAPQPTLLADVLEVVDAETFRLLGRSNDLVNIAGKRSSIGHLNFHLNAIDGVVDGSFWMPPDDADTPAVTRLVAFVVAPGVEAETIRAALRLRVDAAFVPRRIVAVDTMPREATGKLTSARLAELAAAHRV